MRDLNDIRKDIDAVDAEILAAFEKRIELSDQVAEYKRSKGLPVYDVEREKEKKLEKRALSIQLNMAKLARTFVCFNYNRVPMKEQSRARKNMLRRFGISEPDGPEYAALTEDEKSAWAQFAGSTAFLHQAFIDQHLAKLRAGVDSGNAEQVFESRIVLGTLYAVLREWLAWWRENGTYPFERWTYEDEPWRENVQEEDG